MMIKNFIKLSLLIVFIAVIVIYTAFKSPNDYKSLEEKIKGSILVGDYKTAANLKKQLAIYGKVITDICYTKSNYNEDLAKLMDDDSIDFANSKPQDIYKNSQSKHYVVKEGPNKIPYITHHIWITDEKNPRELHKKHIKRMSDTFAILDRQNPNYVHYLWVNKSGLIPESIAKLKQFNVVVKEIKELARFQELEGEIIYLKDFNFGACSDLLRMIVLEEYGGIYMDIDVWLKTEIADLHKIHKYLDLLITYGLSGLDGDTGIPNGFLFISPHHPLVTYAIDGTKKIIKHSSFARYGCNKDGRAWYVGGIVLDFAFYKSQLKNNNLNLINVFIPFTLLFDDTMAKASKHKSIDILIGNERIHFDYIGTYGTTGSWRSYNNLAETPFDILKEQYAIFIDRVEKFRYFLKEGKLWSRIKQKLGGLS